MSPTRVLFVAFFSSIAFNAKAVELPKAERGILNAQSWNFSEQKIPLMGLWIYYDRQLVPPDEVDFERTIFTTFPSLWNDFRDSKNGVGFATYAITILPPPGTEPLALDIPQIYCSYKLWVNGKVVARNGVTGKSDLESSPQWLPQTVKIDSQDTLKLVLHISNFQHHSGGSKEPIYLGTHTQLDELRNLIIGCTLAESITLLVIAFIFMLIYFKKGYKAVILYFLLLCFTWAIRAQFSNQYIFISFFPELNWELMVKIEYLTLYFTMIWGILFLGRLFANESGKIIKYLLVGGNLFFVVFTLVTPAITYTRWLPAYVALSFIVIAYSLITVILALINDRSGVLNVVIAVILGLIIFGYDLLSFEGIFIYNAIIFSLGYIIIFLLLGIALLRHLKVLKHSESELHFDDLYKHE